MQNRLTIVWHEGPQHQRVRRQVKQRGQHADPSARAHCLRIDHAVRPAERHWFPTQDQKSKCALFFFPIAPCSIFISSVPRAFCSPFAEAHGVGEVLLCSKPIEATVLVNGKQACGTSDASADLNTVGERRSLSVGLPPKGRQRSHRTARSSSVRLIVVDRIHSPAVLLQCLRRQCRCTFSHSVSAVVVAFRSRVSLEESRPGAEACKAAIEKLPKSRPHGVSGFSTALGSRQAKAIT